MDNLVGVEIRWKPEEPTGQGFEMIGTLSQMFCSYYAEHTLEGKEILQINASPRPGWFEPLATFEHNRGGLPLWIFRHRPS